MVMVPPRLLDWLDNPILVKHARSRLRRMPLAVGIAVVVSLCTSLGYAGFQLSWFWRGQAFTLLLLLQTFILVVLGASQVGSAVGGARGSGILDFHRVAPLSPGANVLGFFFGAPIREYVLFACTLPFAALSIAGGAHSVGLLLEVMVALVAFAWVFHGVALLSGLTAKAHRSMGVVFGVAAFCFTMVPLMFLVQPAHGRRPFELGLDEEDKLPFFGIELPWLLVVLVYIAPVLLFTFLAARRKMRSDRICALSKAQALAAMASASVLVLAALWRNVAIDAALLISVFSLVIVAILLTVVVTPVQSEYVKGLRRALKAGRPGLTWWHDLALCPIFVSIVSGIVLVAGTAAMQGALESDGLNFRFSSRAGSLALATGVLVVAYFGLAYQFFLLRFGARGRIYCGLFLFLAWIAPLVGGWIWLAAAAPRGPSSELPGAVIVCISPIAGIVGSALAPQSEGLIENMRTAIQAAAITPALFFTFVFNSLLVAARRRVHKTLAIVSAGYGTSAGPDGKPSLAPAGLAAGGTMHSPSELAP